MKLSTPTLDAERDRRWEENQRMLHGFGELIYYACELCSFRKLIGQEVNAPDSIRVEPLPDGFECELCEEVRNRAPEIFQWVLLMTSNLARDVRNQLEKVDQR